MKRSVLYTAGAKDAGCRRFIFVIPSVDRVRHHQAQAEGDMTVLVGSVMQTGLASDQWEEGGGKQGEKRLLALEMR